MTVAGRRRRRSTRIVPDGDFGLSYNNPAETLVSPYFQAVMADSPAAYWRLNETGAGPFKDSANPGVASHNATPNTTIVSAASLLLSDSDASATVTRNSGFTSAPTTYIIGQVPMTVEYWINVSSLTGPAYTMTCNDATHGWTTELENATGTWTLKEWGGTTFSFTGAVSIGVTQHVVFALSAANACTLYLNGAFSQTIAGGAAMVTPLVGIVICHATQGPSATMDEVALYTTELTYAQIRAHYDASLYGRYGAADPRVVHRAWAGRS